jgi:hypothetical protein
MIDTYYYDKQIKKWILQFTNIFVGMQVQTGRGADGKVELLDVPIHYASQDRVVSWINSRFTQNHSFSLPMISTYMSGIELAPERRKGVGTVDRKVFMPKNGVFPNDLSVMQRVMPIPYNLSMELYAYSSNTDQSFQITEQILMLFDPLIQIQKNDKQADWTKITQVELTGIGNEETVPIGTEKRAIIWNYQFTIPIWLTPPAVVKNQIVEKIVHRMTTGDLDDLTEITEDGDILAFDTN